MKQARLLVLPLFFLAAPIHAACEKHLYADRLDFGVHTGIKNNCPPAVHDPIAEKIRQYDNAAMLLHQKGEPELRSSMALIVDEQTGDIVYAKNADARASIASITKLMTAMVVVDSGLPMDEMISITSDDIDRVKGTHSRLRIGTSLSRRDLLHLSLMSSENRAASALARAYPGGSPAFIAAMNRKAVRLGMTNTRFVDSSGLRSDNQSTAEDLARMVRAAHGYAIITELTTASSFDLQMPIYKKARDLAQRKMVLRNVAFRNTNKLVHDPEWQIGISKTGYISEAGHCLVMQATISSQPLIIVLLDADGKFVRINDAERIKRWLESNLRSTAFKRLG